MGEGLIWITGAGGLIGNYLVDTAHEFGRAGEVVRLTRSDLDLTDFARVRYEYVRQRPAAVIHCAALSRSPVCQADPALARKINVEVTRCLAELAAGSRLVFLSTDLVFDGNTGNYDESAPVNPLGVYAETKVAAEQVVLSFPNHMVIRTSLNGGISPTGDRGFNEQIRLSWKSGERLRLFTDEFRNPIHARETSRAIWELFGANCRGTYHLAGSERLSRWQIGELMAARCPDLNPQLEPSSRAEYRGAPRPGDTTLNTAKAQALLSFRLPGLSRWLRECPDEFF
jgi:dTDP-4-dehydrorhamnose reductase